MRTYGVVMEISPSTDPSTSPVTRILTALAALATIVVGVIALLQYLSPPQPIVVNVSPPPIASQSDGELQREIERARLEERAKVERESAARMAEATRLRESEIAKRQPDGSTARESRGPAVDAKPTQIERRAPRAQPGDRVAGLGSDAPLPVVPPLVAATSPLPIEIDSSGCLLVSHTAQGSVPIKTGARICSRETGDYVVISSVSEKEIAYKVNGGFEQYCNPTEHCPLKWSVGQVLFRVRLSNPSEAQLVLSRF